MSTESQKTTRRKERLPGVWLLTFGDALFFGLIPLVAMIYLYRVSTAGVTTVDFIATSGLSIFIIMASIGTWFGEDLFRQGLLALLTVNFAFLLVGVLYPAVEGDLARKEILQAIPKMTRSLFWLIINWWYFTRKTTMEFYRED